METKEKGNEYSVLLEYCRTPRQRQVVELAAQGKSRRAIARELGCVKSAVDECVSRVRGYATVKGVDEKHDCLHPVADSYVVKGTSTLYDSNGNKSCQWVKTTLDWERMKVLQREMANEFAKTLPQYVPSKGVSSNVGGYSKMLAVYPIADLHLGALSWKPETGVDYDVEIAERTIRDTVSSLIDRSPACEECMISNLGDWLHVDNAVGITERSGNFLDVDGRYAKILQAGIRTIRYITEYAAKKHKKVTVYNLCGNHDDLGALWISAALKNIYEKDSRIVIVDSPAPRQYYRFGQTLIGATHGQSVKAKDLPLVMAAERQEDWGRTKFHVWHVGHIHSQTVSEHGGCTVESFRAVAARDAWTNSKGYLSGRDAKAIFYDPELGEIERHIVAIR